MTKAIRQEQLRRIIRAREVHTQEDLSAALAEGGIEASQVTLSRDLRELGVVKTASGYLEPEAAGAPEPPLENLVRALKEFVVDIRVAGNLVVVKTQPGGAGPVALYLDRSGFEEVVGTVAGDDTVFVATGSEQISASLGSKLRALL